jgi:diguanylate cyclase (GGDEF)-like protein/PAS domain S-box-containing protein
VRSSLRRILINASDHSQTHIETLLPFLAPPGGSALPHWLDLTLSAVTEGVVKVDVDGKLTYLNAAAEALTGWRLQNAVGQPWSDILSFLNAERLAQFSAALSARGPGASHTQAIAEVARAGLSKDGEFTVISRAKVILDPYGAPIGLVVILRDITRQQRTEENLRVTEDLRSEQTNTLFEERARALITLNSIGDAVVSTDFRNHVTYLNRMAEALTGWSTAEALGHPLSTVLRLQDSVTGLVIESPTLISIATNKPVGLPVTCVLIARDGKEVPIEDSTTPILDTQGQIIGAVMVFHDVSIARAQALKLSYLAQHDSLTGLPNRVLLIDRVSQAIVSATRNTHQMALLYLDLDRFKHVNDSKGHEAGDTLLQSVATRLLNCVRASDTVSRQGGDEFAILLSNISDPQDAVMRAEMILEALRIPLLQGGQVLQVSASIGIATYPQDGADATILLKNADFAMYQAKGLGRDTYQCFNPEMNKIALERQAIELSLREAVHSQAFVLHYQPQVQLDSGAIVGVEALLRWRHPTRGLLAPAEFMSIAEEFGLIVPIGQWVLQEGCRQARAWQDAGLSLMTMSINISTVELLSSGFVGTVQRILRETKLDANCLELELTETGLIPNQKIARIVLKELSNLGVRLVLDDFGTGYSALSFLKDFPINTLKIDRSFVNDLVSNKDSASIVRAIINLGKNLDLRVVAEGVENPAQVLFLRKYHCLEAQGYYFCRPLGAAKLTRLLTEGCTLETLASP